MWRGIGWVGLVLAACSEQGLAPSTPPIPPVPDECRDAPEALTAYDAIADGARFSVTLMRDERGAWIPTPPLHMPLHHASTITWTDEAHLLDAHRSREPIVVFATGIGAPSIEHDETRGVFFATYAARVERVCPVQP